MKKTIYLFALGMIVSLPVFGQDNSVVWERHGSETTDTTEFIGTINTQPVKFKTCNQERMRIMPDGKIGIATSANTL